jgi:hypothetical protein
MSNKSLSSRRPKKAYPQSVPIACTIFSSDSGSTREESVYRPGNRLRLDLRYEREQLRRSFVSSPDLVERHKPRRCHRVLRPRIPYAIVELSAHYADHVFLYASKERQVFGNRQPVPVQVRRRLCHYQWKVCQLFKQLFYHSLVPNQTLLF